MAEILLLTPQLPYPPHQGPSLRNFHIIRGLARHHQLRLLSYLEPDQEADTAATSPLASLCVSIDTVPVPQRSLAQRLVRLFTDPLPDMGHRLQSPAFDTALRELLSRHPVDIVQIEGIELARMIPIIRQVRPQSRILFDDHNAEAELQRRAFLTDLRLPRRWPAAAYSLIQTRRLRRFEAWACREADWVTVVSERDAEHLRDLVPELQPHVIPNSLDLKPYAHLSAGSDTPRFDVLFLGKMDYRPNIDAALWFGREMWPRILAERPGATWGIVGQQPHPRLDELRDLPGVTITGRVPDILPYLAGASVLVMPFRMGSGTRLKLIEAMAAGKAVVSTPLGTEGYPVEDGVHLRLEAEAVPFAKTVLELLFQPTQRVALGRAAQTLAAAYDWRQVTTRFDALYAAPSSR